MVISGPSHLFIADAKIGFKKVTCIGFPESKHPSPFKSSDQLRFPSPLKSILVTSAVTGYNQKVLFVKEIPN